MSTSCGNPETETDALMLQKPGNIIIRHAVYCKDCFFPLISIKFRRSLDPSVNPLPDGPRRKGLKAGGNLLLGLSGGLGSTVLLDLVYQTYFSMHDPPIEDVTGKPRGGKDHPRNASVWPKGAVCYVETCSAFPGARDRTEEIRAVVAKHDRLDFIPLRLEDAFSSAWWNAVGGKPASKELGMDITNEELILSSVSSSQDTDTPISRLQRYISSLPTHTAIPTAIQTLTRLLLLHTAMSRGSSHLLLGTSLTSLSIALISSISQGGGFVVREEAQEEWTPRLSVRKENGHENGAIRIIRPLRDIGMKECAMWAWWRGLVIVGREKFQGGKQSIGPLTKEFIVGLERDYPSTVSTIARTCAKLAPKKGTGDAHELPLHVVCACWSATLQHPHLLASRKAMPNSLVKHAFSESDDSIEPAPQYLSLQPKKNTVLVSHGRPPWYGEDGKRTCDAYVVAVSGGSGSGKTHVARQIVQSLGSIPTVIILSQDSFYKYHTAEELELAHANKLDFDHPDAIDMPMFASCLADLKACKQSNIPVYSFAEHQRLAETKYLYGATIIITEGIMALQDPALRELYDLKVFVQCDTDLMLARRLQRDVKERGRSVEGILDQYLRFVKPSYDNFVRPTATYADIIVPGSNNAVAIDLISAHIRRQLEERANQFRQKLAIPHLYFTSGSRASTPESRLDDLDLKILPQTPQLEGIFTILRSRTTTKQDFVFFVDRLSTLLVENALQYLPYAPKAVTTPVGAVSHGQKLDAKNICGVSILLQRRAPPTSFVLVGDSTTANGTTSNSGGWGNGFCGSQLTGNIASVTSGTACINTAQNGATTGTFVSNGFWNISLNAIRGEIAKARRTLVTIQFGHNDQKIAPPESMAANLTSMVQQIRAIGGEPVLVTSLTRRSFNADGTVADTLGPWADATLLVAQQQNIHVLDLHKVSVAYVKAIGPDAAHRLNRLPDDNTHLNVNGTTVFGRMVADLLSVSFPGQLPLVQNAPLSYNNSHGIPSF
ncbi:hypothetical protein D9615_004389 [Tricholomella constricta]|uniref:Cytoplasmic tRNA 2-thiolation protein 2 n=1 Tax=Tricholomella constricta TaxID=117010 RepID=A0A8H5M647_9AGAR|nr:hypothetical protein D9615_004389 [Tricholomella constricta]